MANSILNAYTTHLGIAGSMPDAAPVASKIVTNTDITASNAPNSNTPAATITWSAEMRAALVRGFANDTSGYTAYFPTRDGTPAAALAIAVSDPGAASSSRGLTFDQVAINARSMMDAKYAAMDASGQPFDFNSFEGKDWFSLMGDLDRRSLYAISSNEGEQFSAQEQEIARSIMSQQQGLAMGMYTGPISQASSFHDPYALGDIKDRFKAGIAFLLQVSPEEKQSAEWMQQYVTLTQAVNQQESEPLPLPMTLMDYLIKADQESKAVDKSQLSTDQQQAKDALSTTSDSWDISV